MKPTDYINGDRHGRDAHRIELEAMSDPLTHDALEGFDAVAGDHGKAIRRLQERVSARSARHSRRRGIYRWSSIAAVMLLCVAMSGWYLLREARVQAVYSDMLLPEGFTPVDFEMLNREESVIKVEERVAVSDHLTPATDRQSSAPAIREVSQAQLDSLVALRSFDGFVDINMEITTDAAGVRVSGRAVAEFSTDSEGRPRKIRILESPAPAASREAVRLIRNAPEWPDGITIRVEVDF